MPSRLRRVTMWLTLSLTMALVATWFISGWNVLWVAVDKTPPPVTLGITQGRIFVIEGLPVPNGRWVHFSGPTSPVWHWSIEKRNKPGARWPSLPIWPLVPVVLTLAAITFWRARTPAGFCRRCKYPLGGISGPCPECGRPQRSDRRAGAGTAH